MNTAQACTNYQVARDTAVVFAHSDASVWLLHELFLLVGAPGDDVDAAGELIRYRLMRKAIHKALNEYFEVTANAVTK